MKKYITTGKASRMCGVGINTMKRWIQKGELKCVITPGGHWRIAEDEFQRFLDKLQTDSSKPAVIGKVLLIEDDPAMRSLIEGAFELAGYETDFDCAHDGYSGLMKIGAMRPDLVVLDIMLPEINGLELMQRIRTSEISRGARILVITGAGDRRLVKRALDKARPDAIFLKPFDIDQLIDTAYRLLSNEAPARSAS